jgi:phosphoglycerate kinase
MKKYHILQDLDVKNKRIIVRTDLNVPMTEGIVTDNSRIARLIPTITYLLEQNAKIIIISHFGRPRGEVVESMSLAGIIPELQLLLGRQVKFCPAVVGRQAEEAVGALKPGEIIVMENLRFLVGEEQNDINFAVQLAALGEVFVNDTLSCSHRAHASITGLPKFLPSCAGLLLQEELGRLEELLLPPKKPVAAIVAGAKISTKLTLLHTLIAQVDVLIIGGAMANSFLKSQGFPIGNSLCEDNLLDETSQVIKLAAQKNCQLILPSDVVVAREIKAGATSQIKDVTAIASDDVILDIGPKTVQQIESALQKMSTIVWNGPLGVCEVKPYDNGTNMVANIVAQLTAQKGVISIAGGGDIVAALKNTGQLDKFTYISTAGGAFLEWLEGKELPGIMALQN